MKFFTTYFKQRRKIIGVFIPFVMIFLAAFLLYHLPAEAVAYPALVCGLLGVIFVILDYRRAWGRHRQLMSIREVSVNVMEQLPDAVTVADADYQKIIGLLLDANRCLENEMNGRYSDMVDYYTLWAHQIKTPIASMRLNLQNEDSSLARQLSEDLFRIEQYVEMVLCYLRLDAGSTDYVIREYALDDIVRQAVKKLAGQFIRKKLTLVYEPLNVRVLTDEKWLLFVLEQVLSNALKYTPSGRIVIDMEAPKTLCIRDTGIGIAPEDLPRIFEKGYTGYNGRSDKKASGIGLYLCRRICKNLGHTITANSSVDSGTVIRINLEHKKLEVE